MNSQTYVTDPVMWENFYKNMSKKSFDPYKLRKQNKIQTGRGLYGRFRGSYLIPVNPNSTQTESTLIQNKLVAPVEADAERAESELKENNSKKKPHVKILKSIKVKKRKNIVRKKKGVTKKSSKKKSVKQTSRKRKHNRDYIDSVWKDIANKKKRKL